MKYNGGRRETVFFRGAVGLHRFLVRVGQNPDTMLTLLYMVV
jgi:hypothetical protein